MTGGAPGGPRDETLQELLRSPLEDRPPRRTPPIAVAAAAFLVALAVIAVPILWLGAGGSGDDESAADGGSSAPDPTETQETPDVPGVLGYPTERALAPAVQAGAGRVVVLGGVEGSSGVMIGTTLAETWTYLTGDDLWYRADEGAGPSARFGQSAAYDAGSGLVVMFGGGTGQGRWCRVVRRCATGEQGDTWWFSPDTGVWNQAPGEDGPAARFGASAAYDSGSDRVVLFGGARMQDAGSTELFDDTWAYDVDTDTWTAMSPDRHPPLRAYGAMTYDPEVDRVLLFGGSGIDEEMDAAVWAYDVDADVWEPLVVEGDEPDPTWDTAFVYADVIGKSVLIGGEGPLTREIAEGVTATEIGWSDQVWVFDARTAAWSERGLFDGAIARHSAAYDPETESIVVHAFGHTLLYDPATDAWEDRTPGDE